MAKKGRGRVHKRKLASGRTDLFQNDLSSVELDPEHPYSRRDVEVKGKVRVWYDCCLLKRLHCCEWFVVLFSVLSLFYLRNYVFQSDKKCEMTSSYMISLHIDLNEAAKWVDIIPPPALLDSLSRLRTHSYEIQNGDDIWPNLRRSIIEFIKVQGLKLGKNSRLVFSYW